MSIVTLDQPRRVATTPQRALPFLEVVAIGLVLVLLWLLWVATARTVTLTVDGMTATVRTHRQSVAALLIDVGLDPDADMQVSVPLGMRPNNGLDIVVQRAHPMTVQVDGRNAQVAGLGSTIGDVLTGAGILVDAHDKIALNGEIVSVTDPIRADPATLDPTTLAASSFTTTYSRGYPWVGMNREPFAFQVQRAMPIVIDDGGIAMPLRTTAQTVGEALRRADITLYLGDEIQPALGSPISTGLRIYINRSTPVSLRVDGRFVKTRTQADTVAGALTEMQIGLAGLDMVEPALDTQLYENLEIQIKRVREDIEIEEDIAPFETVFEPDRNLLIDTQQLVNPGAEGITRRRYRVRYEEGQEVARVLEDTWVAQEPATRVIAYGQKIEPNTAVVDGEELTYWRRIRMLATSYSASTAGVSPDAPWFGQTYTGDPMRKGIVAVDPVVVPLRTRVYVPNYGYGDALDTGSAILARRIDLGYDDGNLQLWNNWTDVYLLWPPPPEYQITWVLPNWPRPPQ